MIKSFVYLAVIVSGASVLAIELLGTRVIAPFYGVSLFTWSALISVTLAALSVGYALGGRWADRGPKLSRFCTIIGLAGLWIIITPWLRTPVLATTEPLGLRTAVLIAATVLFFPPLALLGMVSPYAIRLVASSLDVVGRTAGNLYAVSTVASVAAALATGFFLIPNVGLYHLILSIGVLLLATAAVGFVSERKLKTAVVPAFALVAAGTLGWRGAPAQIADPESGLLAVEQSAYAELRVVDRDDIRFMLIDGGTHTIVDRATGESVFPYVNVLDIPKGFFQEPGDMLLVGLGGGSVVKRYARDGWRTDAVEIDPAVTQLAREYFMLKPDEAQVFEMDGRQFLISSNKTYDLIIMDAFGSSAIPFHLVTKEAFALIRSRLAPDGVLAMNIEAVGWRDKLVLSLAATAKTQFEHVLALPIAEPPNKIGNLILLMSNRTLELAEDPPVPSYRFSPEYDRAHAWDNRFVPEIEDACILTDELSPVDVWAERINLVARKELHQVFKERGISW